MGQTPENYNGVLSFPSTVNAIAVLCHDCRFGIGVVGRLADQDFQRRAVWFFDAHVRSPACGTRLLCPRDAVF